MFVHVAEASRDSTANVTSKSLFASRRKHFLGIIVDVPNARIPQGQFPLASLAQQPPSALCDEQGAFLVRFGLG